MSAAGSGPGTVEAHFHGAMVSLCNEAKRDVGYNATRFLQMVSELGGVEAARHLLRSLWVSDGFTTLWEQGRLDLSVEAHVLRPEFEPLFGDAERRTARERLEAYSFTR